MLFYLQLIETEEERSKFEILYTEYRGLMFHVASQFLQTKEDVEDAVHHAFLKVVENIKKIDDPVSQKTKGYLVTIVENRAIDICRVRERREEVPFDEETTGLQINYLGDSDLSQCLAQLPARYREIILLKYDCGFHNREIAKMLNLTEPNVKRIVSRAKSKLYEACHEGGLV